MGDMDGVYFNGHYFCSALLGTFGTRFADFFRHVFRNPLAAAAAVPLVEVAPLLLRSLRSIGSFQVPNTKSTPPGCPHGCQHPPAAAPLRPPVKATAMAARHPATRRASASAPSGCQTPAVACGPRSPVL